MTGDGTAVEQLVATVWPVCFRLAASVIGDWSLAQDAAQETCVIVNRKVRNLRNAAAFDTWLYRIVMRESTRIRRQQPRGQMLYADFLKEDNATTLDVWRALADLPPELRDVTVLFYFDDLKSDEIAAILGVANPTVRTRLSRARERLRGLLNNYEGEPRLEVKETEQHGF